MNEKQPSYFNAVHKQFFFLIGQTDDEFCTASLQLLTLEEILHQHLMEDLHYHRVVFFNHQQKLYFHDPASKKLSQSPANSSAHHQTTHKKPTRMCAGPLGQRKIRASEPTRESQNTTPSRGDSLNYGKMPDSDIPATLNRLMQESQVKTAVVFSDGLGFISYFDTRAQADMATYLNAWKNQSSINHNICIFLLQGADINNLHTILNRHQWYLLSSLIFKKEQILSDRVISIPSPRQDEVANLLNYWRIKNEMKTHWLGLSDAMIKITRKLCSEGKNLKYLSYKLQKYSNLQAQTLKKLSDNETQRPALERLQQMRGLESVTQKLQAMIRRHKEALSTEESMDTQDNLNNNTVVSRLLPDHPPPNRRNLHLVLKGNPGTGKTTVARLIAEIYRDQGLLDLGHVVKASREDLVAGFVGQTAIRTAEKITEAMGGVLFVDEAYRFTEGGEHDFGKEAIETLMEAMENHKGEFAVIIAGYPQRIESFLDSNPGLRRRFSENNTITIEDYSPEILQHIFEQQVHQDKRQIADALQRCLADFFINLHRFRTRETFGNAGDVLELYAAMDEQRSVRVETQEEDVSQWTLIAEDIPKNKQCYLQSATPDDPDAILDKLDHLIGLNGVKQTIHPFINAIKIQQLRGEENNIAPGHYLFVGLPGTGKTTVARLMGDIFKALNILQKGHLIEVGRVDLVAGYVGQSALKTQAVLERSLEGVLFIDEAYQLVQSEQDEFGKEALETLVAFMENNRQRLCLICAGYPEPMRHFVNSNPGLPSRFSGEVIFESYHADEMLQIFKGMAKQKKLTLGEGVEENLLTIFQYWEQRNSPNFANGRDVRKLLDACCMQQNARLIRQDITDKQLLYKIEKNDVETTVAWSETQNK